MTEIQKSYQETAVTKTNLPKTSIDKNIDQKLAFSKNQEISWVKNEVLDSLFNVSYDIINWEIESIRDTQFWADLAKNFENFVNNFWHNLQTLKMGIDMRKAYAWDPTKQDFDYNARNLQLVKNSWQNIIDFQLKVENLKSTFPNQTKNILQVIWGMKKTFTQRFDFPKNISSTKNIETQTDSTFPTESIKNISWAFEDLPWGFLKDKNIQNIIKWVNNLESDLKKMPWDLEAAKKTISGLISLYNKKTFDNLPYVKTTLTENIPWLVFYYSSHLPAGKQFFFEDLK